MPDVICNAYYAPAYSYETIKTTDWAIHYCITDKHDELIIEWDSGEIPTENMIVSYALRTFITKEI